MRARWANICLSKLLCICPSLFEKLISTKQDITSTEISYQFLAPKIALLRRNKAPNSSTSTDPFSAATKTLLVLCISQFQLRPVPNPPSPRPLSPLAAGHLLALSVPGEGHLQILGCTEPTLSFWHVRDFLSEFNYTKDFTGKTSRLAHLPRTGKNWRSL